MAAAPGSPQTGPMPAERRSRPGAPHPALEAFVRAHAAAGDWPGAAYAAGPAGEAPRWCGAAGALALDPRREEARADALYDLASLTKPLALGAVLLRLADAGRIDLDAPLAQELPEFEPRDPPSYADLMAHRYGLPAWAPLYRLADVPAAALAAIAALPPKVPRGTPLYSCPSAIAAKCALERGTGRPLRALFREYVAAPLGLGEDDVLFSPVPDRLRARCAPTERGRTHEDGIADAEGRSLGDAFDENRGAALVPGDDAPLRGVVHDGNAAFLGGDGGNAGLFATAAATFRLASALAHGPFLSAAARARLTTPAAEGNGDVRTFGFKAGAAATAPVGALGPRAYGHNGFTGTSVWIAPAPGDDPPRGDDAAPPLVAVLLANRVHPRWTDAPVQAWRRAFHDAVVAASGSAAP